MDRRTALEAAATLAAPWPASAQTPKARIGVLAPTTNYPRFEEWQAFVNEMARRGYREGREIEYVHRAAGIQTEPDLSERLRQGVEELSRLNVNLIYVVEGDTALPSIKRISPSMPVVVDRFYLDPVERGLVASLARPGGNVTGNAVLHTELESKMVELLLEAMGAQPMVGYLDVTYMQTWPRYPRVLESRRALGRTLRFTPVFDWLERFDELDTVLGRLKSRGVRAVKFDDPEFFVERRGEVAAAFTDRGLAAVSNEAAYTRDGLLLTFGWDVGDIARRSAAYVDRILRGTRPQDLPVEQVSTFKVGVNLATARALAIRLPRSLVVRAHEVIE